MSRDLQAASSIQVLPEYTTGDDIAYVMAATDVLAATEDSSDPLGGLAAAQYQRDQNRVVVEGSVVLLTPYANSCRVKCAGRKGVIPCRIDPQTGPAIRHGDPVLVALDLDRREGLVLGRSPRERESLRTGWSDAVMHGSGVGLFAEGIYRDYVKALADGGGMVDSSDYATVDNLPGDWSQIATTGVGFHSDRLMAFMRASELCGVWCFYEDGLLRVAGEALDLESDVSVRNDRNDNGEAVGYSGAAIYPWEELGQLTPAALSYQENPPADVVRQGVDRYAATEDLLPFRRYEVHTGYTGQGVTAYISTPRDPDGVFTEAQASDRIGLSRVSQCLNGALLFESATNITLAKTAPLPVPTRIRDTDSQAEAADGLANYRFSGREGQGDGPEHKLPRRDPDTGDAVKDAAIRAAAPEEGYAYQSAWLSSCGFVYHTGDFELSDPLPNLSAEPDTSQLGETDFVLPPETEEIALDHRTLVKLRRLTSLISMQDDGSITLRDGLGAELKLSHGVATLSGTGVYLQPAKTLWLAASRITMRSHSDLELVSARGSVRIKAERDAWMLAGNSGQGCLLLESRSQGNLQKWPEDPAHVQGSGVILKSAASPVSVLSAGCLIRTGVSDSGVQSGSIVIDAGGGRDALISRGSTHLRYTGSTFVDCFKTQHGRIKTANVYSDYNTSLQGSLGITGHVTVGGGFQAAGSIVSAQAQPGKALLPSLVTQAVQIVRQGLQQQGTFARDTLKNQVVEPYEAPERIAHPETAGSVSFGFPSSDSAAARRVVLVEPYWQRLLGESATLQKWEEPAVRYRPGRDDGADTHAWPGKEAWQRPDGWVSVKRSDDALYDQSTASPKHPRKNQEAYENAKSVSVTLGSIADNMKVFVQ